MDVDIRKEPLLSRVCEFYDYIQLFSSIIIVIVFFLLLMFQYCFYVVNYETTMMKEYVHPPKDMNAIQKTIKECKSV